MTDGSPLQNLPEWVKAANIAALLQLHVTTVQRWAHDGKVRSRKLGRLLYVHRDDVQALFQPVKPWGKGKAKRRRQKPEAVTSEWAKRVLERAGIGYRRNNHAEPEE